MQSIKFPIPNRSEYIPSPYEPDADGVLDVGYYKGSITGGRPYVLECWQMDELIVATVFFSDEGLDAYEREDLVLLLELEGIIKFVGSQHLFQCTQTSDDAGMPMWAVNITLQNAKGKYAEVLPKLRRYR